MEIKNYLDNIKKMADDSGIECEIIIEKSRQPDKAIVELAYKYEADVLIMGRHGRRGLLKLLAGSMTSKVIGHGFPQVLVVPKNFTIAGEKILLATDGSSFSSLAAEEAISMAKNCTTLKKTFVLSVADREDRLPKAETLAKEVCEKIKNNDINTQCVPISAVGRPSDIIANTAKKYNIDMIIMGGHGKGLTKLLMGHVTEKVIAKALCGVLVVENTNA
jgi:nucleotide-binding universal stress UspA family protein